MSTPESLHTRFLNRHSMPLEPLPAVHLSGARHRQAAEGTAAAAPPGEKPQKQQQAATCHCSWLRSWSGVQPLACLSVRPAGELAGTLSVHSQLLLLQLLLLLSWSSLQHALTPFP